MLISRGYRVAFELESGRMVRAGKGAEILHSESGAEWPEDSVLVASFKRTGKPLTTVPDAVRKQVGEGYDPKKGRITLPPKRLSTWREVGPVVRVEYHRRGEHHAPDGHEHVFGSGRIFSSPLPVLYRRGDVLRLDGASWDWAGAHG
jgi:hypothetical protein